MALERVDIEIQGSPWSEEHMSRYYFIRNLVDGKIVLDIACGTGFGCEFLMNHGVKKIYAADISTDAINICTEKMKKYSIEKWDCSIQDGTSMSYQDNYFDLICSFETIEHISKYDLFISEINRVLKPGGILVISTPNSLVTNPSKAKPKNIFHFYEFEPKEMEELLNGYFQIEVSAGQHLIDKYNVAPFLPSFDRNNLDLLQQLKFIYWRVMLRVPKRIRNFIHRKIFNTTFYPSIEDYTFLEDNLYISHIQYYICRKNLDHHWFQ